ncbi:response regulator transcription factor [Pseudomonas panipatensis]|uniref:Two-component system, NarL family, response regulator, fimbrial Z protein, FimZ/two-component system, NarL family, response regulator EvgA n=1 Tax=Pseudomonas panipatensis TaxID=428992 RepID=A0A1G8HQ88_9PSED|nr:response regulator transcription factor [Pseudomonas panipatensis]SDI08846.1 two-component system, NarL family, response regulator, fimbrial Z protein, FimZ/two-component system, NarL family, response regulator EvgA [Pseudomonas panipatensis]SMP59467.1 two component transcriptional regulator, LuxR family [Pseudomonas panipatensis]
MNKRVVLVEDHPAMRLAIRTLLSQDPQFEIVGEAADGHSGLNLVRQERPDLVILDLNLPGLDGMDLLARVHIFDENIRLLVLSSQDERLYANRVEAAGAHGFVSKNKDTTAILNAARMLVSGYRCFPERPLGASGVSGDDPVAALTPRELVVLRSLVRGMSNKLIAEELFLSQKTVSTYKTRILEKLQLESLVDLVEFARSHNLHE